MLRLGFDRIGLLLRGETHATYDDFGNVLSSTDALGHITNYVYDATRVTRREAKLVSTSSAKHSRVQASTMLSTRIVRRTRRHRAQRIYRATGLTIRRKKRKHCLRAGKPLLERTAANQEWALDRV